MKKKSFAILASLLLTGALFTNAKAYAEEAGGGGTVNICPGSPEACKGSVDVPNVGTITVNSTKNKGGGTVTVS